MPLVLEEVASREVRAVVPPTPPLKVMLPAPELMINALEPLIVLLNEIALPAELLPNELNVIEFPSVTAPV